MADMPAISVDRLVRIRQRLVREGIDALACRLPENVLCLSGYWPLSGVSFLVVPQDGEPLLIAPATEAELLPLGIPAHVFPWGRVNDPSPLVSVCARVNRMLAPRRLGWEADFEAVAPAHVAGEVLVPAASTAAMLREAFPGTELMDASALLAAERAIKLPHDLAGLRQAAAAAERGVLAFEAAVRPGVSEPELLAAIEGAVLRDGLCLDGVRSVRAYAQVLSGPRTAGAWGPAYLPVCRQLEAGDIVLLELATVVDGYWSDLTRVRIAGTPQSRQREVHGAVQAAVSAALAAVHPGAMAAAIDAAARASLHGAGLAAAFPHHTGHGLGFRYHEPLPFLHPHSPHRLEAGMVCTIEPGVYVEGFGGLRIEENIVVSPTGSELLSVPARAWA